MQESGRFTLIQLKDGSQYSFRTILFPTQLLKKAEIIQGEKIELDDNTFAIDKVLAADDPKAFLSYIDENEIIEVMIPAPALARDNDDISFGGIMMKKEDIASGKALQTIENEIGATSKSNSSDTLFRSYIKQRVKISQEEQDRNRPNIALTIKLTKEAISNGFKKHMIFGIDDPPRLRQRGIKTWLESSLQPLEVQLYQELHGIREIREYIDRHGEENCQLVASSPSVDNKAFAYDDSDKGFDKIADDISKKYLSGDGILMNEPWVASRAAKPSAIFIAVPEKAISGTDRRIPETIDFHYTAYFTKSIYSSGLRALASTCLDGYTLNRMGVLIFSETEKGNLKKAAEAIQDSVAIEDKETGERLSFEVFPATEIENSIQFSPYTAFQNLDPRQKKALKSWLKTDEKKRKHAVLKADISGSFFSNVIDYADNDEDGRGPSMDSLANLLAYMLLTLVQSTVGRNCQIFFILRKAPSEKWKAIRMEEIESEEGVLSKDRVPEMLSVLADEEIHILILPGTQADSFSVKPGSSTGLELVTGGQETEWLNIFRKMQEGFISSLEKSTEDNKEKNAGEKYEELKADSIRWNEAFMPAAALDVWNHPLYISAEPTAETILTIMPDAGTDRKPGAEGWYITLDRGIPLSKVHRNEIALLISDHQNRFEELRRLSEAGNADISIDWLGVEHKPGRKDDPIRFITTFEADDSIEDDKKGDESIASMISDGRLRCGIIRRPDLGISLMVLSSPPDMFFDGMEGLTDTPDMAMMRAIGQNPSKSAFKRFMSDLERFELRTDAIETIEAVFDSDEDLEIPPLEPISHPVEITAPKGTVFGLVEDIVLLPNGKNPPKAYISIWSADMKGKFKAILDYIPEELSERLSILLMMMKSDEKILEIIERLPEDQKTKNASVKGGRKQGGTRSVKTISLTREFRHQIMREKAEHTPVPRSTEGKVLADVSVRKHVRYQAYGPGYSKHRLITIESYAKRMFVNPGQQTTKVIR